MIYLCRDYRELFPKLLGHSPHRGGQPQKWVRMPLASSGPGCSMQQARWSLRVQKWLSEGFRV